MRRTLSNLLGVFSLITGMLIVLPRIHDRIWRIQLFFSEFPWVTIFASLLAIRKPRTSLGQGFGLVGLGLSLVPIYGFFKARTDMDAMMKLGFGTDYEQRIPDEVQERLSPSRWWFLNTTQLSRRKQFPDEVKVAHDLPFMQTSSRILKLDVYRPPIPPLNGSAYPAVIVLHGGGWRTGDKGGRFKPHCRYLAAQGYVVFDVQYRLTALDGVMWPCALDDVREAVRWVKSDAHVRIFKVDPERIALFGRSAGGHLALSAAYRACNEYQDTKVRAVIAAYAPTNLRLTGSKLDDRVLELLGGTSYEIPEAYAEASPLDFAGPDSPPTLLIHGSMDALVSPLHAELVLNRLRAVNVPTAVLRVPWQRHGFDALMAGLGTQLTQYYVDRFLALTLYGDEM